MLEDRTGSDANPALLCYVRKGKDLVDTLHRKVLADSGSGGGEDIATQAAVSGTQDEGVVDVKNAGQRGEADETGAMDNVEDVIMDSQPTRESTAPLIEL